MASGQDLLRYMTSRMVEYMETPKKERKQKKAPVEPWTYRWFGLMPLSLRIWTERKRRLYERLKNRTLSRHKSSRQPSLHHQAHLKSNLPSRLKSYLKSRFK